MELKKDTPPRKKRRFRSGTASPDAGWGPLIETFLSDSGGLGWFMCRISMLRIGLIVWFSRLPIFWMVYYITQEFGTRIWILNKLAYICQYFAPNIWI